MAWSTWNAGMNPFAQGGEHYDALREGRIPYGQNTVNPNPGKLMTGTEWWNDNPYAAGGRMFGKNPYVENNNITNQLMQSPVAQKPKGQDDTLNPLSELLKQLLNGLGGPGGSSGGSGGGSSTGGMGSVTSGIDVGPVYSPTQVQGGIDQLKTAGSAPAPASAMGGYGGAAGAALQRQYGDAMRGEMASAATDFSRGTSYANAQQQLASEKARAQSNLSNAELLARLQAQQYANDLSQSGMNTSLLGGLIGLL